MAAANAAHAAAAAGGGGGPAGERPMTLASFLKINLPTFQGTTNPTEADDWISAVERALLAQQVPDEERKSPREAKKNMRSKENRQKAKKNPTQHRPRACALKMARPCPPFFNMEVSVGGAPARPRWCARATLFHNAQDKDLTRPRDGGGAPARRRQNSLK
ncbi:hypothetical protein PIB30_018173 [Stylosanthes scabra]|uniref:Uncharacterized protein n=1 Tax=Stylosanthes scabra TaxID=79078 RepID=A0ABU6S8H5_9FABA|nr:hypothetical protein [Stylosanthes scabra]